MPAPTSGMYMSDALIYYCVSCVSASAMLLHTYMLANVIPSSTLDYTNTSGNTFICKVIEYNTGNALNHAS